MKKFTEQQNLRLNNGIQLEGKKIYKDGSSSIYCLTKFQGKLTIRSIGKGWSDTYTEERALEVMEQLNIEKSNDKKSFVLNAIWGDYSKVKELEN